MFRRTLLLAGFLVAASWPSAENALGQADDATLRALAASIDRIADPAGAPRGAGKSELARAKTALSGRSVLAACPSLRIACGDSVSGQLSTSSCALKDGSFVDTYYFNGLAGQTVTISMTSPTFDTFLFLNDPFGSRVASNDDFGGSTNARIVFTLPTTGAWSIQANSLATGTVGNYNLSLACTSSSSCNSVGTLICGVPVTGSLTATDCAAGGTVNAFVDLYDFDATAGVPIVVTYSAPLIPLLLTIQDPSSGSVLASKGGTGSISLSYTPAYTGRHLVGVTSSQAQATGPYSLAVNCGLSAGCVPGANALCLNNGRFRVTASFQSSDGSGAGQAVPLTGDTGYFWFFTGTNVEMVVKVVNGCSFNSRYWTFAGGLTNVAVTLTVIDTQNGSTRTYVNPAGTAFAPIQDTAAFSRCP